MSSRLHIVIRRHFSNYYDYHKSASCYDIEKNKPIEELKVLDAGCGTGNYLQVLHNCGVRRMYAIELNKSMINECMKKNQSLIESKVLQITQGNLLSDRLPFDDEAFDCIMLNQVIHHLETESSITSGFTNTRKVLQQFYRCLNNDKCSVVLINFCAIEQVLSGLWFSQFIPQASAQACKRLPKKDYMKKMLEDCKFEDVRSERICEIHVKEDVYYDLKGINDFAWRAGHSTFALAPPDELKHALHTVNAMIATSPQYVADFINHHKHIQSEIGSSHTFFGYKLQKN
ncbi:methionine biosynthesis protein MetW [Reticulomyxa filosa]|uniref:Methionine biosynthesis protein MetW n=1 Tax=Reticulomyxa filosa TaxID=46433 RepID=X6P4Q9_RETFI|nr:methionine biosynthesis protein MetW [Reticulomyxa filosa]|eukprot:ETO33108.1 methionine biosynthesis protein MetW [Reticulomyxa filosa]